MQRTIKPTLVTAILTISAAVIGCSSLRSNRSGGVPADSANLTASSSDSQSPASRIDPTQQKISLLFANASIAELDEHRVDALRSYEKILELDPGNPTAHHRAAVVHVQLGHVDDAEKHFRKALELAGDHPILHNDYGYFRHLCDDPEGAEEHLTKATELAPDYLAAHNNLGLVLASEGRIQEAEVHFQLARCSRAESLNNQAFSRFLKADLEGASNLYKEALRADPNHEVARDSLASLEQIASGELAAHDDGNAGVALMQTGYSTAKETKGTEIEFATPGE
jgi:Flp pilus assembly protein TadD